jgi:hypothetical protein
VNTCRAEIIQRERSVTVVFSPTLPERSDFDIQREAARAFEEVVSNAKRTQH